MIPPETRSLALGNPQPTALAITSWESLLGRAEYFAKSQLIPTDLRNKPADVAIILQMGHELGIDPMQAINGINVIKGKPSVSPELALGMIRSRFPNACVQIKVSSSPPQAEVIMARDKTDMAQAFQTTWTMDRAKAMGLAQKDNYKSQPEVMLKWRAVGEAARTIFPDVLKGLYFAQEVEDLPPEGSDKGDAIAAALARPVEAVVLPTPPPALDTTGDHVAEVGADPILDYVVPVGSATQGKRLREFPAPLWLEWKTKTIAMFTAEKKEARGPWLECFEKIDAYVELMKQPPVETPSVLQNVDPQAEFEPGAAG